MRPKIIPRARRVPPELGRGEHLAARRVPVARIWTLEWITYRRQRPQLSIKRHDPPPPPADRSNRREALEWLAVRMGNIVSSLYSRSLRAGRLANYSGPGAARAPATLCRRLALADKLPAPSTTEDDHRRRQQERARAN